MRKHNKTFATRWRRTRNADGKVDRSNFPQTMAHRLVNDKGIQLFANGLLSRLLKKIGAIKEAPAVASVLPEEYV